MANPEMSQPCWYRRAVQQAFGANSSVERRDEPEICISKLDVIYFSPII